MKNKIKELNDLNHLIEIIDIVDRNNQVIGQASKQEAHKNKLLHRSTHVIIFWNNLIFLQLRSANKSQFLNKWDVSASGHLITQENYITGAQREIKEELGLDVLSEQLIEIGNITASEATGFEFIKIFQINYFEQPLIILNPDEITTGGWFSLDHINSWLKLKPEDFAGCFEVIIKNL
ncbi:MAG: NUDIX domain-containing protein [Gammaproteobacteria bacterium]|nr:NUDIX domain-containing protein [Gammaproteobacteria bacterium]